MSATHKWICGVVLVSLQGCAVSGSVDIEAHVPLCPLPFMKLFDKPSVNVATHVYFSHGQP